MTSERWQQVKALLDEALDRPLNEREAYLDSACDDAALRDEVRSLLAAHDEEETGAVFESLNVAALFGSEAAAEGRRIGPYRIIKEIGRGGMGAVYLASRDDGQYEREVALKIVRPGWDNESLIRRFYAERQILASFEHPHIARLYDGGLTDDGRPYLAMEHIEGRPIDVYCDENGLSIQERMKLVLKVIGAVAYAHRRMVVHRDLKPSNVLVTEEGAPKLLDFGVAKLLAEEADAPLVTGGGLRLMTPEYAAPEQVCNGSISMATDVYALGVLLYRLLAGRRPYDFEERTPTEIERVVCEEQPTRPSMAVARAVEGEQLERGLRPKNRSRVLQGDLDRIILKALRKEPEERYASAEALADDIKRHLHGQPVVARAPTWRYRTRKFVARNRWGVAVGMLLVLLLTGYAATVTVQSARVAHQRNRAQLQAEKAAGVSTFLAGLLQEANPEQGPDSILTTKNLLDFASSRIAHELDNQPVVQMRLMNIIGVSYRNRGFYEEALALLLDAPALGADSVQIPSLMRADFRNNMGEVLYYLGRHDEARQHYERSLALRRRHLDSLHIDVAQSLNNLALINLFMGDLAQAESRMRRGLAIFSASLGPDHWRIANAKSVLAQALTAAGALDEARALFDSSIAMHRRLHGEDRFELALVVARQHLGNVLRLQGDAAAAEAVHRETLEQFRRLAPPDHPFIGEALTGLAAALHAQGQYSEAREVYRQAITQLQSALREGDARLAEPMVGLGRLLIEVECSGPAAPLLRRALRIRKRALPAGHRKIREAEELLGLAEHSAANKQCNADG